MPEEQRPDGFAAEGKVRPRTWARGTWAGAELRRAFEAWAAPFGGFPGQPGRPTLRIRQLRNSDFGDSPRGFSGPQLNLATQKGETKINPDTLEEARTGACWNQYLDGGFGKVERSGQLAPAGPRHIVLPVELLLQARDLFAGERRAVAPHLIRARAGADQRCARAAAAAAASMQAAEARARRRRRGARG